MTKRTDWNGAVTGRTEEDKVCDDLDNAGIKYKREHVAHSNATAKRGHGEFDIDIMDQMFIEVKSVGKNSMSYSLDPNKKQKGLVIKTHQLQSLYKKWFTEGKEAGLYFIFRPLKPIYVRIEDFYKYAIESTTKSITYYDSRIVGREVDGIMDIVNEVIK